MTCRLCLGDKELCGSHIIPEAYYKAIYDELHRLRLLSTNAQDRDELHQKGVKEKLLCVDCERHFNEGFEKYALKVLQGIPAPQGITIIKDVDYHRFKLFQLSILWRAGIARHRLFTEVNLGHHEEKLRKRLFERRPGEPHEYGCCMIFLDTRGEAPAEGLIDSVDSWKHSGHTCYKFIFGRFIWIFFVSSHSETSPFRKFFLSKDGKLTVHNNPEFVNRML